jgi:hypothetical protein
MNLFIVTKILWPAKKLEKVIHSAWMGTLEENVKNVIHIVYHLQGNFPEKAVLSVSSVQ